MVTGELEGSSFDPSDRHNGEFFAYNRNMSFLKK